MLPGSGTLVKVELWRIKLRFLRYNARLQNNPDWHPKTEVPYDS